MRNRKLVIKIVTVYMLLFLSVNLLFAQGYGDALKFQGLDRYVLHSATSRAMGGVSLSVKPDIGLMFHNPATLQSLQGMQVSIGGQITSEDQEQEQHYAPVRYFSNLSLLLEGLTDQIPDPDPSLPGFTAQDTVQRPYDDIEPNWSRSDDKSSPIQAMLALPFKLGDFKFIAGLGAVRYADLQYFYQHNNVLSPSVLSQRPLPTFRPTDDNPIDVQWWQSIRLRKGSIQGYGVAMAASIEEYGLSFGFSGMVLDGSSNDRELQLSRGKLTFFSNAFRLDSLSEKIVKTGTSDYTGQEYTLSSMVTGKYVSLGFSLKLPTTITRTYNTKIESVIRDTLTVSNESGEDELKLPWRGTIGLVLTPTEKFTVGLEYEFRPYESVQYIDSGGIESNPWLPASLFRIGAAYSITPWLAIRGGMRGDAAVFEPEGNQIKDEPVSYNIYSAGIGLFFSGLNLNVTYEYSTMKYQDTWASAISKNNEKRHTLVAQLSYGIL